MVPPAVSLSTGRRFARDGVDRLARPNVAPLAVSAGRTLEAGGVEVRRTTPVAGPPRQSGQWCPEAQYLGEIVSLQATP